MPHTKRDPRDIADPWLTRDPAFADLMAPATPEEAARIELLRQLGLPPIFSPAPPQGIPQAGGEEFNLSAMGAPPPSDLGIPPMQLAGTRWPEDAGPPISGSSM